MTMRRVRHWSVVAAAVLLAQWLLAGSAPVEAHWADQAAAEIVVTGAQARVTLTVPTGLVAFADDAHAGRLTNDEIRSHREALTRFLSAHLRLSGRLRTAAAKVRDGVLTVQPFAGMSAAPGPAGLAPATHTTLALLYTWPAPVDRLTIRYDLFLPGVSTASGLATVLADGQVHNVAFTPGHRDATIVLGAPAVWQAAGGFVVMGIEHILTGYDHMLFLLSLLMVGAALPQLLKIVTAFTVAHSITLSLAVLGVVDLPSRWVESAIALSITYVAAENIWRGRASLGSRWLVTFAFGLVHGLGFASALTELHLPRANVAASLVGFNLGVEIGQVSVILLATLALDAIRQYGWAPVFRRCVSAGAAVTGLVWFVQRALPPL
ncbi:MAG TPA: HupE/UreJ family protein [bacterium]|nr:HupE/UreJ family protein [bacterium]